MKKITKLLLSASLLTVLFAGCSNGSLIANDTLDAPELNVTVTENGVAVIKWDDVKDAASYNLYVKAPGREEFTLDWGNANITRNYATYNVTEKDADYTFKVVALPSYYKTNLLSSEAEETVTTPEAWVDTAAPAASDLKLTLVANTLNKYELSFPVNPGFNYSATFIKATAAADASPADLWASGEALTGSYTVRDHYYYKMVATPSTGGTTYSTVTMTVEEYENYYNNAATAAATFMSTFTGFASGSTTKQTELNTALATLMNNPTTTNLNALGTKVSGLSATDFSDVDDTSGTSVSLDTIGSAYNTFKNNSSLVAILDYEEYDQNRDVSYNYNPVDRNWIGYHEGVSFVTELDDDDNVVAPVFDEAALDSDGIEYRVIVKMTPVNSTVATTKYILSSQTVKFDATGFVEEPYVYNIDNSKETKTTIYFSAGKYNGTEISAESYRLYQVLVTDTWNEEGVPNTTTKTVSKLGTAEKDTDVSTKGEDYVAYKAEFTVADASKVAKYSYTWYAVYTTQTGDIVWKQLGTRTVAKKS